MAHNRLFLIVWAYKLPMQSKIKKVLLIIVLLCVIAVVALPFIRSDSVAFLRASEVVVKLSTIAQQPVSDEVLSDVAGRSLQRIEAAQASIEDGQQYKPDQLSLNELEIEIADLSAQEAPAIEEKFSLDSKFDEKQPSISDNYEPGIALDILEKETGLNRNELESLLLESR